MRGRAFAITITMTLAVAAASTSLAAGTPGQTCEGGKVDTAGRYFACVAKAERGLVSNGDTSRYDLSVAKCALKFTGRWGDLETSAVNAGSMCPSEGDAGSVQDFLDFCEQGVAVAVGGGVLPSDCLTCDGDLAACEADLATTQGDFAACMSGLGTCDLGLSSALSNLTLCSGSLTECSTDLGSCSSDLATAEADLTTCNGSLGNCDGDLTTCIGSLSSCNANYASCSGSLATANAGTAAAVDVLFGKTFSSVGGLGASGTMENRGAVTITPTTADQAIAVGYHNGSGKCAGDVNLVAGNIKSGVNLFGVAGTLSASVGGLQQTGQTTCYNATGQVVTCAGSGQDGELQKGAARSFTDNGNGTVTDNLTGLMWEKQSDDGTIHDKDNAYTWENAFASKIATLNGGGGFAGHTDWRVPNIVELESLRNFGAANPSVYSVFNTSCMASCTVFTCSCTLSAGYWSSSTSQSESGSAWYVRFNIGETDGSNNKGGNSFGVRAVRAGS